MHRRKFLITLACLPLFPYSARASSISADLIYFNGKISTFDAANTLVEAVAVKDGKFLALGSSSKIKEFVGPQTVLADLKGRRVVPGLIDAHCHPMETIYLRDEWVDCRYPGVPSVAKALENIGQWAAKTPKGQWIFAACVSASQDKFLEKRLPTRAELDKVAPDNPVAVANGAHLVMVNSMALKALGIKKGMQHLPDGATIILDDQGEPTGAIADAQADLPDTPGLALLQKAYSESIQSFWNANGFTSLLAITPAKALPVLKQVAGKKHKPSIRYTYSLWTSADGSNIPEDFASFALPEDADPDFYRFFGIKGWIDGENDARTGYMCDPYLGHSPSDPAGGRGTLVTDLGKATQLAKLAGKNKKACMLHCSGGAAMDIGLTAYEQDLAAGNAIPIKRIEHFGVFQMNDTQIARAKALKNKNFFISVQPNWLVDLVKSDYINMGAAKAETGFRFRTMIDAGLEPAASTDMTGIYLGNINPFIGIHAAVTRDSDRGRFLPQEAITVEEALKMWTIWAARSMGESDVKGSIEIGKFADMTVLSDDIFSIPKEQIKDIHASQTIVAGNVVYEQR